MFDASLYNITVRKGNFDDEVCYEAKVKELPDVAEYADSYEEAYLLAIDTIETTAEALSEQGKTMPSPILENDEFSGRVTLRMPKSTHAAISQWADTEEISLNQLIVNCLSFSLGHQFGAHQRDTIFAGITGNVQTTDVVKATDKRLSVPEVIKYKRFVGEDKGRVAYGAH
jgi:predicted HicB family RNase H-like nuclease